MNNEMGVSIFCGFNGGWWWLIVINTEMGVSVNGGTPKTDGYFRENPTKIDDDWGYPHDLGHLHIFILT